MKGNKCSSRLPKTPLLGSRFNKIAGLKVLITGISSELCEIFQKALFIEHPG